MIRHLERPARGEPEGLLVLMHGRGADEHDLFPLLDWLDPQQRLLGVTPRAPLALPPGGAHWYAFYRLGEPDPATFWETYPQLTEWLDAFGFPPEKTILGGFSQGSMMAYALALDGSRPKPAGVVALSGFLPTVPRLELSFEQPLPPFAIGHGISDDVISVEWGRQARDRLTEAGADVLYRESPMAHSIDPDYLREVAARVGTWI